jgi:hypothetical protein
MAAIHSGYEYQIISLFKTDKMQRRSFVELTSMAVASTFLPFFSCSSPDPALQRRLSLPTTLATINDPTIIAEVGKAYMEQVPGENSPERLIDQLMISPNGDAIQTTADSLSLQKMMSEKVQADFDNGETVVVRGWVLSRTEARQCALFSLTNPNI